MKTNRIHYKGEYFNDQKQGQGEINWPNGSVYKGKMHNNKLQG